jgi:PAS domain S-box-containing protein
MTTNNKIQTDTALRESEERYRALFDRSLDGVYIHDFEGKFLDANPAALAMLGYERGEIASTSLPALLDAEDLPRAFAIIEEVKRTGKQGGATEFRVRGKNGRHLDLETRASLLLRDGKPFAVQGIFRDITERKRAEEAGRRQAAIDLLMNGILASFASATGPRIDVEIRSSLESIAGYLGSDCGFVIEAASHQAEWIVTHAWNATKTPDAVPMLQRLPMGTPNWNAEQLLAGKPVVIKTLEDMPPEASVIRARYAAEGIRSRVMVPLRGKGGHIRGCLGFQSLRKVVAWTPDDVRSLQSLSDAIANVLERKLAEAEIAHTNRLYSILSCISQIRVTALSREELLDRVCRVAVEEGGFQAAWIGWVEPKTRAVLPAAWAGEPDEYFSAIQIFADDLPDGHGPTRDAICEGKPCVVNDFLADPRTRHWRQPAKYAGIAAAASFPIRFGGEVCGAFTIFDRATGVFQEKEVALLIKVTENIASGLSALEQTAARLQAEERIREQAAMLALAHDGIIGYDLDNGVVYWNASAERLYGWSAGEAMGRKVSALFGHVTPRFEEVRKVVLESNAWAGEMTCCTRQGQEVLVEGRFTLIRDQRGNPKSILAIYTDITERKRLETQFLRAQRMESIGALAGGIAHDLNNVLAPIMMSCQLLDTASSASDRKDLIEIIRGSTKRGADLVKQILAFCRGASGRRVELAPKHLIHEARAILSETFPKSIHLTTDVAKDLWLVAGDATQLHQVLLNLCVNARDAMPEGGQLTVRAENAPLEAEPDARAHGVRSGRYVLISVTDSGTGIPREIQERIFDPFFTTKEPGKGTGLGLSTSLNIVKNHGGYINLYSEPGRGTVFKVYLPALTNPSAAALPPAEASLPRGSGEVVLVVDDEASIRLMTTQTLQLFGYRTLTAKNGADAIALYQQHREEVAVVLTDLMMPVMGGLAMIRTLLTIAPHLKIIAASGLEHESNQDALSGRLVKALLPKPFTSHQLLTVLDQVLQADRAGNKPQRTKT